MKVSSVEAGFCLKTFASNTILHLFKVDIDYFYNGDFLFSNEDNP